MQLAEVRKQLIASAAALLFSSAVLAADLDTDEAAASYGIGYGFASNLLQQTQGLELDVDALVAGIQDALEGDDSELTDEQINTAVQALQQKQQAAMAEQQAERQAEVEATKAEGAEFLADNAEKDGITVTDSGLQYEVLSETGSGESPTAEDTVEVHYHGTLMDGTVFDSSVERGEPVEFPLANVIAGWTEGLQLMTEGDKYKFYIPADLAYGDRSPSRAIPAGSTLIFEVELLSVVSAN